MLDTPQDLSPLDRFRQAVMADEDAQQMLCSFYDPGAFEHAAIEWATQRDIPLQRRDLAMVAGADPVGIGLIGPAPQNGTAWPPRAWLPFRFALESGALDWCHFAGLPLTGSFYSDTLRIAQSRPFNRLFRYRMGFDALLGDTPDDSLLPDGFIFHMSRCGSTLVSQMLAAAPANIVVSEAEPLDAILQLPFFYGIAPEHHVAAVRAMLLALGRNRSGSSRRFFVKVDSWHALFLPLFRQAFPDTPWIFLYRDPVEVLVSQKRMRGQQAVPGVLPPQLFGIAPDEQNLPDDDYAARILARTCEAALDNWDAEGGMLVNYHELPDALYTRILPHFGVTLEEGERALMDAASRRDAKATHMAFMPDSATKRDEADDAIRAAASTHFPTVFARLEAIRASSPR